MTAADEAYNIIRQSIVTGQYTAGAHLKEEDMAEQLGLSRTPIRQALQRLHNEGWVEAVSNRGTFVRKFDQTDTDEAYNVRMLLEPYAAELAATRITAQQLAALRALNSEMEAAVHADPPKLDVIQRVNDTFHKTIILAAGNQRLQLCLQSIIEAPIIFRTFSRFTTAQLRRSLAHHEEILAALEARDAGWAKAIMLAHISAGRLYFDEQRAAANTRGSSVAG